MAVLLAGSVVPPTYDITDAAERLGVSKRWLQKFLRQHPVDTSGVPFYIPIGNRKRFTERDLERFWKRIATQKKIGSCQRLLFMRIGLLKTKRMKHLEIRPVP